MLAASCWIFLSWSEYRLICSVPAATAVCADLHHILTHSKREKNCPDVQRVKVQLFLLVLLVISLPLHINELTFAEVSYLLTALFLQSLMTVFFTVTPHISLQSLWFWGISLWRGNCGSYKCAAFQPHTLLSSVLSADWRGSVNIKDVSIDWTSFVRMGDKAGEAQNLCRGEKDSFIHFTCLLTKICLIYLRTKICQVWPNPCQSGETWRNSV